MKSETLRIKEIKEIEDEIWSLRRRIQESISVSRTTILLLKKKELYKKLKELEP